MAALLNDLARLLRPLATLAPYLLAPVFGAVALRRWHREGRSARRGFGLTFRRPAFLDFGAGLLICLLAMAGIFLVELALGGIRVSGRGEPLGAVVASVVSELVPAAILEEVIFRALLLSGLVALLGGRKWPGLLISAAIFGAVHLGNDGATPVSAFGNALGGLIYGIAFLGGRNLWLPLGLHLGWNASQGSLLGFPVSGQIFPGLLAQETVGSPVLTGGAYGPEAGAIGILFRFVVIALLLGYLRRRCGGRGNIATLDFPIPEYDNPPRRASSLAVP